MKRVILLLTLLLSGCASTMPKTVNMPVPVQCPKPNIPEQPHYPIKDLKQGDQPATVMKAYVATVVAQQNFINQLITLLRAYHG